LLSKKLKIQRLLLAHRVGILRSSQQQC